MKKQLLLNLSLTLFLSASFSACDVPNAPEGTDTPSSETRTDASTSASVSTGQPTQAQFVAAMQCAATALAESNRTMSRIYQQQAEVVGGWPTEMWTTIGLHATSSAQLNAYEQVKTLAPDCIH